MKWFLQGQTFCLRIRSFLYNQKQPKPPNSISRNGYFVQTSLKLDRKMKQTDQIDFGLSSDDHQVWFVRNKPSIWRIKCDKYSGSTCWWLLFKCFSLVSASLLLLSWCFTFSFRQIITIVYWLHTWTSPINFLNHIPFFHRENRPPAGTTSSYKRELSRRCDLLPEKHQTQPQSHLSGATLGFNRVPPPPYLSKPNVSQQMRASNAAPGGRKTLNTHSIWFICEAFE